MDKIKPIFKDKTPTIEQLVEKFQQLNTLMVQKMQSMGKDNGGSGGSLDAITEHPYYPNTLPIYNYTPSTYSKTQIAVALGIPILLVSLLSLKFISKTNYTLEKRKGMRPLTILDRLGVVWLLIGGLIRIVFGGYFAVYHKNIASDGTIFGDVYREMGYVDSRYLINDPLIITLETLMAVFVGPLCILTAISILRGYHPIRHTLQFLATSLQLHIVAIYMGTNILSKFNHTHPDPKYLWRYSASAGLAWVLVPLLLFAQSAHAIVVTFKHEQKPIVAPKKQN
ncbi:3-beta-hydroxysteroid-Delta(8),Delta(7)-isomerase [Zancudomyces culisetae]|uniref:3-beta-hydroxysteroid-Delta(8), Delta(7)-isomerase n=1 Tax=Zancudomyces culisetae TaxID=1213189 RepID=A0A1R1PXX9_ZANCU|nr:3-beta-hydroxysteroid-Delta(8),Delta(7)-isomerase [Zancudomyces culisetae]|eukprot:OMH85803.1 3-beta-hydroxysteroid-Delta(8),Delta(7)-isomerase [Zancudomyces culisetae]